MTQIKNARLSAAVTAAMGGALLAFAPLSSNAQDPLAPAGFSATQTGQVMIVPYYTVNGDWNTSFNLINTSTSALLVKVRFHEARNSRDVRDFNVMMSPKDVWSGYVASVGEGEPPMLVTSDESCTTPQFPVNPNDPTGASRAIGLSSYAYTGINDDGGLQDNSRLNEGYVEFLVIGECQTDDACLTDRGTDPDGIGYLIQHDPTTGLPRNCGQARTMSTATLDALDFPTTSGNVLGSFDTVPGMRSGAPSYSGPLDGSGAGWGAVRHPAPLKGNVTYVNSTRGSGAGTEALHFDSVAPTSGMDDAELAASGLTIETGSLVTAQNEHWFLEPTIATMPAGLWNVTALNMLESRITWTHVYNEWASNPANNAYTDWVINFPTKGYHVDQHCDTVQANNNAWRNDGTNVATCNSSDTSTYVSATPNTPNFVGDASGKRNWPVDAQVAPFNQVFNANGDGKSLVNYGFSAYDREEMGDVGSGPVFSPNPLATVELPYETNVIRFQPDAAGDPVASDISSYMDVFTAIGDQDATNGWVDLDFTRSMPATGSGVGFRGLPVYGFAVKVRQPVGAPHEIGQMMNHGYGYAPN